MPPLTHTPERRAQIISGNANPELGVEVAKYLNTELGDRILEPFADSEIRCRLEDSLRGNYVFVLQSHGGGGKDPNIALMEQALVCRTARDSSADKVIAICPYLGYSRQDRMPNGREPIAAALVCDMLMTAGATSIVSIDLHTTQTQGFFDGPFTNLTAGPELRAAILPYLEEGVVVVSPDAGRVKTRDGHRDRLPAHLNATGAYIDKSRPRGTVNQATAMAVIGEVEGRQCLIVDDMIDSAGTLAAAAKLLMDHGAKEVLAMATHAILSGKAVRNLGESAISRIVVTDTRALTPDQRCIEGLVVASVAPLIARAIHEIFTDGSISKLFQRGENYS